MGPELGRRAVLLGTLPPRAAAQPPGGGMTVDGPTLRLVLGDQLDPGHAWFHAVDPRVVYVLMEVR